MAPGGALAAAAAGRPSSTVSSQRHREQAYSLPQQLPELLQDLQRRAAAAAPPARYILKPWSSSRCRGRRRRRQPQTPRPISPEAALSCPLGHTVTAALATLLGCAANAPHGPRLACRYVDRPLLVGGRKAVLRLHLAVASLSPPVAYASASGWCTMARALQPRP